MELGEGKATAGQGVERPFISIGPRRLIWFGVHNKGHFEYFHMGLMYFYIILYNY